MQICNRILNMPNSGTNVPNFATRAFEWVETRLDQGAWFRRLYLGLAMWMNVRAMLWATEFASVSQKPGLEIAAIIAAVAAIPGAVMAHAFQVYLTSRN